MKKGMAALLVAGLVGWTSVAWADDPLPRAKPEDVGLSSERLARIATFAKAEIDAGQIPGAVVAVARRGKLVYFEAFGQSDKKAGTPMTTDTIFSLASMTKPMTTVAALQLYEQGRLLIDDPLAKYFPKFADMKVAVWDDLSKGVRDTAPAARQITIQDLMRHTSGLSYGGSGTSMLHKQYAPSSNGASRTLTGQELMDKMTALPLAHQPGTVWEYSFGLDVLGFVVEKITQKPLGEALQEMIWKPLGMVDTGFVVPADKAAPLRPRHPGYSVAAGADQVRMRRRLCGGHAERLSPLCIDAAERRQAGRDTPARPQDRRVHDGEPAPARLAQPDARQFMPTGASASASRCAPPRASRATPARSARSPGRAATAPIGGPIRRRSWSRSGWRRRRSGRPSCAIATRSTPWSTRRSSTEQ